MDSSIITKYFPQLSPFQQEQFAALGPCYQSWNAFINTISRKDIDHLYLRHILHSLSIAKFIHFSAGAEILDIGTGGGFPGIPLSILFPEVNFFLCDSIGKKVHVVNKIAEAIGLKNVTAAQIRAQEIDQTFDYALARAVAPLDQLVPWVWHKIKTGMLILKGGDLEAEVALCVRKMGISKRQIEEISVSQWLEEKFFEEKKIVYICK